MDNMDRIAMGRENKKTRESLGRREKARPASRGEGLLIKTVRDILDFNPTEMGVCHGLAAPTIIGYECGSFSVPQGTVHGYGRVLDRYGVDMNLFFKAISASEINAHVDPYDRAKIIMMAASLFEENT